MSDVLQPEPDSERNLSIRDLIADFSIEATPRQIIESGDFAGLLPGGTSVYVPFLPWADLAETAAACRRLEASGLRAVPHLAARAVASVAELDAGLARLADGLQLIVDLVCIKRWARAFQCIGVQAIGDSQAARTIRVNRRL